MPVVGKCRLPLLVTVLPLLAGISPAQSQIVNRKYAPPDAFRQLDEVLPTPNSWRAASGAPGHEYWQQKVDYDIAVELNDDRQMLTGSEEITYTNNSPDTLRYLWLQLDQNRFEEFQS